MIECRTGVEAREVDMRGPWRLATNGCDRATGYHMSNKVIRRGDELFVTWLDSDYRSVVAAVDPDSGGVVSQAVVAQGFDNHCGAAMAMTPDGVVHVMNGSHHRGFVYRFSADPGGGVINDAQCDVHLVHLT